jgi:hypothetical protein
MLELLVNQLVSKVENFDFVTKAGGLVVPLSVPEGKGYKNIPARLNDGSDACNEDDYISYLPDDRETGIVFFEGGGSSIKRQLKNHLELEASVRLVGWFNQKLTGTTDLGLIKANIIRKLPASLPNTDYMSHIRLNFKGEAERNPAIFKTYIDNPGESQVLSWPFDYFALNYSITYRAATSCVPDVVLDPDSC